MATSNDQWENYGVPPLTRADRLLLQQVYRSTQFTQPTKKIDDKKPLPPNYFDRYIQGTKSDYRLDYLMTERSIWGNILQSRDTAEASFDFRDFLDRSGLRGVTEKSAADSIASGVMPSSYALHSLTAGSVAGILSFHKNEHLTYMRRMLTLSYQQAKTQVEISSSLKAIGILLEKANASNGGFGNTMVSRIREAFKRQTAAAIATSLRELSAKGIGWAGKEIINFLDLKALLDGRFHTKAVANRLNWALGGSLQKVGGLSNWLYGVTGFKPFNWSYNSLNNNRYALTNWLTHGSDKFYKHLDSKFNQLGKLYHFGRHTLPGKALTTIAETLTRDYKSTFTEGMDGSVIRDERGQSLSGNAKRGSVVDYEKKALFYAEAQSNYLRDIRNLIAQGYGGGSGINIPFISRKGKSGLNLPDYSDTEYYNNRIREQEAQKQAEEEQRQEVLKERFNALKEEHPFNYEEKADQMVNRLDKWWKERSAYFSSLKTKGKGLKGLLESETKSRKLIDIGWKSVLGGGLLALGGLPFLGTLPIAALYNSYMTGLHNDMEVKSRANPHLRFARSMANLAINFSMLPKALALPFAGYNIWTSLTNKKKTNRNLAWMEHGAFNWGLGDIIPGVSKLVGNLAGLSLVASLSKIHGPHFSEGAGEKKEINEALEHMQKLKSSIETNQKDLEPLKQYLEERDPNTLSAQDKKAYTKILKKYQQLKRQYESEKTQLDTNIQFLGKDTYKNESLNKLKVERAFDFYSQIPTQIATLRMSLANPKLSKKEKENILSQISELENLYASSSFQDLKNTYANAKDGDLAGSNFVNLINQNSLLRQSIKDQNEKSAEKYEKMNKWTKEKEAKLKTAYANVNKTKSLLNKFIRLKGDKFEDLSQEDQTTYTQLEQEYNAANKHHQFLLATSNPSVWKFLQYGGGTRFFEDRKVAKLNARANSILNSIGIFHNDAAAISEEEKQLTDATIEKDPQAQADILRRITTGNAVQIKRAQSALEQIKELRRNQILASQLSPDKRNALIAEQKRLENLLPELKSNLEKHNSRIKEIESAKPFANDNTSVLTSFFKKTKESSGEPSAVLDEIQSGGTSKIGLPKTQTIDIHANVVNLYGKSFSSGKSKGGANDDGLVHTPYSSTGYNPYHSTPGKAPYGVYTATHPVNKTGYDPYKPMAYAGPIPSPHPASFQSPQMSFGNQSGTSAQSVVNDELTGGVEGIVAGTVAKTIEEQHHPLSQKEIDWLNNYHQNVNNVITNAATSLSDDEIVWLSKATAAL